jgi:peptidoglycan/xylan/chitin deacetylase (PgdA/CDA1 family)
LIRRQLRTTVILLLITIGCLGAGLYFRFTDQQTVSVNAGQFASPTGRLPISEGVMAANERYNKRDEIGKASLVESAPERSSQRAELVFLGLGKVEMTRRLLETLKESDISAAFFVTGDEATENVDSLSLVYDAGYPIGLSYLRPASNMSVVPGNRTVSDLYLSSAAIQTAVGIWPMQLLTLAQPDDELLAAAYSCSIFEAVLPTKVITLGEVTTMELSQKVVSALPRGSILCVRLDGPDQDDGYLKQLCAVLMDTNIVSKAKSFLDSTSKSAEPLQRAYTSERASAFTFSGLGNRAELDGVLSTLKTMHGKATFFITRDDMALYPDDIRLILSMGHDLGISVQSTRFSTASAILEDLLYAQEEMRTTFAYDGALSVRPAYGSASEDLKKACGAGGFPLISAMVNAVRTEDIRKTDAAAVIDQIFPKSEGFLQRGEIVHFQMKQYQKSDTMLASLVHLVATSRNIYAIKPIMEILGNAEYTYTYPVPEDSVLPSVKDVIYPGQLTGDVMAAISSRYIGIDWVSTSAFLPGFTSADIKRLDKKGFVKNDSNMIFLTFDDWGTDGPITALLDVLKAHDVKGTFFIRTQNIVYNPNLVRAIAAEGHTIASHTNTHYPLSNDVGTGRSFSELTEKQIAELTEDLVTSYKVLQSIVGDVKVNGRAALAPLFRPPTMAVSRNGLVTVFDCGFTYSVSGSYATQDYKAPNASSLVAALKKNTKSGAVFVMHMSDTSLYTAEALDIYLKEMELLDAEERYKFVSLIEVLK